MILSVLALLAIYVKGAYVVTLNCPAWRSISRFVAPVRFFAAQRHFQCPALREELMANPRLRPRLAIDRRLLNIHIFILRVKVDGTDGCLPPCYRVPDTYFLKEWRIYEVNILPGYGKQAHDREEEECSHGS